MHSVKTCSHLSIQKLSELLGENNNKIVFNLLASTDAVSYTHLDVYKRQR